MHLENVYPATVRVFGLRFTPTASSCFNPVERALRLSSTPARSSWLSLSQSHRYLPAVSSLTGQKIATLIFNCFISAMKFSLILIFQSFAVCAADYSTGPLAGIHSQSHSTKMETIIILSQKPQDVIEQIGRKFGTPYNLNGRGIRRKWHDQSGKSAL